MKQYRVGIVGCGRKAWTIDDEVALRWLTNYDVPSSHASAYAAVPETKLVAATAKSRETVKRFGERWGVPPEHRYTSYQEMLAKEELDIVSVTTHADLRAEITIAAAEASVLGILRRHTFPQGVRHWNAWLEIKDAITICVVITSGVRKLV